MYCSRIDQWIAIVHPVHLAHQLYATQPGVWPAATHVATPTVNVPARAGLPAVRSSPYLDALALLSDDGGQLVLLVVNRHPDRAIPARLRLHGFALDPTVRVETIRGTGMLDHNTWQEPDRVSLKATTSRLGGPRPAYPFEPCSVTALSLSRRR